MFPTLFFLDAPKIQVDEKSFSFSWKTAMSLPFTTSNIDRYRRLLLDQPSDYGFSKENYELRTPKQRNNIHFRDLYFATGEVPVFVLTKKELDSIIVRRIFDGLKRNPLENIEPNLGDVPGLCPDQSKSQ